MESSEAGLLTAAGELVSWSDPPPPINKGGKPADAHDLPKCIEDAYELLAEIKQG